MAFPAKSQNLPTEEELRALAFPSVYLTCELGVTPYDWQADVLDEFLMDGARVALRTCNESGKTSTIISGLVLWHMEMFPQSLTITTSGSYNQIVHQLYPNLKAFAAKSPGKWKITKDGGLYLPTGSRLHSFSTDDPGRAEGWHEPPMVGAPDVEVAGYLRTLSPDGNLEELLNQRNTSLLMIVDEAKSVEQGIFDAFERCHPTRILIASTPGEASGPFYDCFHAERERYHLYHASYRDCPHLYDNPIKMRERDHQVATKPKWLIESMWEGEFTQSSEFAVFDLNDIEISMGGTIKPWGRGQMRAALDLANGGDEICLYIRDGNKCWLEKSWRTSNDLLVVNEAIQLFRHFNLTSDMVYADGGGLGKVILNTFERKRWPLHRLMMNAKARDSECYSNVRAEMYCELANRLHRQEIILPRDAELRDQLSWHKRCHNENPIRLEPKKKMPRSPDRADTVAMLFYDMPDASQYEERRQQKNLALSECPMMHKGRWADDSQDDYRYGTGWWD